MIVMAVDRAASAYAYHLRIREEKKLRYSKMNPEVVACVAVVKTQ